MIKLIDQPLPDVNRQQLVTYQTSIDNLPTYTQRVEQAKIRWTNQSKTNTTFMQVKQQLIAMCPGERRCCYCEDGRAEDIEHFRPKTLYPELTFVWENYLLACSTCNSVSKKHQFAIFDVAENFYDIIRLRNAPIVAPPSGEAVLINPRYENPLDYLKIDIARTFNIFARSGLKPRDEQRAKYTIDVLQLTKRSELAKWRTQAFKAFIDWTDSYRTN